MALHHHALVIGTGLVWRGASLAHGQLRELIPPDGPLDFQVDSLGRRDLGRWLEMTYFDECGAAPAQHERARIILEP